MFSYKILTNMVQSKYLHTISTDVAPAPEPVEPKKEEFEPTDASGNPLFGLRALKKTPTSATFTATQSAIESTSSNGIKLHVLNIYRIY